MSIPSFVEGKYEDNTLRTSKLKVTIKVATATVTYLFFLQEKVQLKIMAK
jgi:hypothetical protein